MIPKKQPVCMNSSWQEDPRRKPDENWASRMFLNGNRTRPIFDAIRADAMEPFRLCVAFKHSIRSTENCKCCTTVRSMSCNAAHWALFCRLDNIWTTLSTAIFSLSKT